jgi:hypothetical protein
MSEVTLILLLAGLVLAGALLAWMVWRGSKSRRLRRQFGPEYEQTLRETGSRSAAERELEHRRHRIDRVTLRDLDREERREFGNRWRRIQVDFVDRPREAVEAADNLVSEIMLARGYPAGDFRQRVADASVGHAEVTADYRQARAIAEESRQGRATTEELRRSLVCYRNIFQEMLGIDEVPPVESAAPATRHLPHH